MSSKHRPSNLEGIKRLAKAIKRESQVPHHRALDLASREAGFEDFRHAQNQLVAMSTGAGAPVFLTAYWRDESGAGMETLKVDLSRQLSGVVTRRQLEYVRQLRGFKMEAVDHLEYRHDIRSQDSAREKLVAAARTLIFMSEVSLVPVTTRVQSASMRMFSELPRRDHDSEWIDPSGGSWVYMDEPYGVNPQLVTDRQTWAAAHGVLMLAPTWEGVYSPGNSRPFLFTKDAVALARIRSAIANLKNNGSTYQWTGQSGSYFGAFTSPGMKAAGKIKRRRPMPPTPGVVRNGALPYWSVFGGSPRWRPAKRMSVGGHTAVAELLKALINNGGLSVRAEKTLGGIRSDLDDWVQKEHPAMSHEKFSNLYYGGRSSRVPQNGALDRLRRVKARLVAEYPDVAPLREICRRLERVERSLVK